MKRHSDNWEELHSHGRTPHHVHRKSNSHAVVLLPRYREETRGEGRGETGETGGVKPERGTHHE